MAHSPHLLWLTVFVLGTHRDAFQPLQSNNVQRSLPFVKLLTCSSYLVCKGRNALSFSDVQEKLKKPSS